MSNPLYSDFFTIEKKKVEHYSDFLMNFDKNPVTGFLAKVSNEESVRQSIRQLVLTDRTERFYAAHIGSKIHSLLFEPMDSAVETMLKETIAETINNNEPRCNLVGIEVRGDDGLNVYFINVVFSLVNAPSQELTLEMMLRRVR